MNKPDLPLHDAERLVDLQSPLLEFNAGEILSGVISPRRIQPSGKTSISADAPHTVAMPAQQWAYGILLPFDHKAIPEDCDRVVVRLKLSVQDGTVGIAGVDATLSTFTTAEYCAGDGETDVTMLIERPANTHAIVLRTTSSGGDGPTLRLLDAAAHRPDTVRLAPRRHDLGYDLFVILSLGKTATQTVEATIRSLAPSAQVRRLHFISTTATKRQQSIAKLKPGLENMSSMTQVGQAEIFAREIDAVRALGGSIAVISGMRDPIDRVISGLFEYIPTRLPFHAQLHRVGPWLTKLLRELIIEDWRGDMKERWDIVKHGRRFSETVTLTNEYFATEVEPIIGVEIPRHPFNRSLGYTLLRNGTTTALLYRFEDIAWSLPAALTALTGRKAIRLQDENHSDRKEYAGLYRDFKATFRIPADLCAEIYARDPYIRHFYSEAEIEGFKARWSEPALE